MLTVSVGESMAIIARSVIAGSQALSWNSNWWFTYDPQREAERERDRDTERMIERDTWE